MNNYRIETSPVLYAWVIGLLYLNMIVLGIVQLLYVLVGLDRMIILVDLGRLLDVDRMNSLILVA